MNNCFSIYHTRWITSGPKSNFICDNIPRKTILFFFGCSEVNGTWLITSELANQRTRKVLFTCVVYTKNSYSPATCLPRNWFRAQCCVYTLPACFRFSVSWKQLEQRPEQKIVVCRSEERWCSLPKGHGIFILRSSQFLSFFRRRGDRTCERKAGERRSTPGVS